MVNTIEYLNIKTNVVKIIDFNKPEWKNIIHVNCEIHDNGDLTYSIQTVKGGAPDVRLCNFRYTEEVLKTGNYCLFSDIAEFDKFWVDTEVYWDAVEIALNEFVKFLKENYGKAKK